MRFFNTAGPCKSKKHYTIPPLERFDLDDILMLIDQEKYFVLHAPRQTGKTTCMLALMEHLNQAGKYHALYMNVEAAQAVREDVVAGIHTIVADLSSRAINILNDDFIDKIRPRVFETNNAFSALNEILSLWAANSSRPVVLIIDEIDSLVGDTLISVLRQIRSGYDKRPANFPQSIILCGVRDVRDYRIHSDKDKSVITGGSAFNIKAESLRLGDFTKNEVESLLTQHTNETGQTFTRAAVDRIWAYTLGQPWLVSALAYEVCFKLKEGRDRSTPIAEDMITQAKESLILRRETHLDQLADKLKEERVRSVVEPVLMGMPGASNISVDDLDYVYDLGLIRRKPHVAISNPIYTEIIPRMLVATTQEMMSFETLWYVKADGSLDTNKLLIEFQEFFREHSEHWIERFSYKEAGPQLLLQAFLQRIVNSGGRIEREYGLGRMRTDLLVIWNKGNRDIQKTIIELKILYKSLEKTIEQGLAQTARYMERCGSSDGHLVIFNRGDDISWDEKIFSEKRNYKGRDIMVWGM
ncbi:ATP-binding protein [Desulfobacula sp.]|uniref:ATP-binding protein n=1 Tax=Desulfobacula sp. TaxID=2593537 RepID=UPI002611ACF3|nr:ATP-binding protein [Desulfobacula sp.]